MSGIILFTNDGEGNDGIETVRVWLLIMLKWLLCICFE